MRTIWGILICMCVQFCAFGQGLEFRGGIGDSLKIVMTLKFSEGKVVGYYYYSKYENEKNRPYMKVEGTMDASRAITLDEIDMKKGVTAHMTGKFTDDKTIAGEWSKADGSKKMPFTVSTTRGVDEKDPNGMTLLDASGLDAKRIATNLEFLKANYKLKKTTNISADGKEIVVELYTQNGTPKEEGDYSDLLYRIACGDSVTAFTEKGLADEGCCIEQHKVEILESNPKMLNIEVSSGSNSWNSNPNHLISLDAKNYLKYLGYATDAARNETTGEIEITKTFDRFEGISFLCHADAPGEWAFYKEQEGVLVLDLNKNGEHWKRAIEEADQELAKTAAEAKKGDGEATVTGVRAALRKVICAHLAGKDKEGLEQLNKDLLLLSEDGVTLHGNFLDMSGNGLKIADAIKEVKEGFKQEERDIFLKDMTTAQP